MIKPICFVGFMSCGKTTIGKKIATILNTDFYDTDQIITEKYDMCISDIFSKFGQDYFINEEFNVIKNLVDKKCVISVGGAAFIREKTYQILKTETETIYIKVSANEIYNRLLTDNNYQNRPNIISVFNSENPIDGIEKMLFDREKFYKNANYTIENNGNNIENAINSILSLI